MDPALHESTERLGARLRDGIARLPGVTEVRGAGLMVGFDLAGGGAPDLVVRAITEQRLLMNATGPATIRLLPPLVVTEAEIDDALGRLGALLRSAVAERTLRPTRLGRRVVR